MFSGCFQTILILQFDLKVCMYLYWILMHVLALKTICVCEGRREERQKGRRHGMKERGKKDGKEAVKEEGKEERKEEGLL